MRVVEIKGSGYDMGYAHGKACPNLVRKAIKENYDYIAHLIPPDILIENALHSQKLLEGDFPEYFEELRGIADGANVLYKDVAALNLLCSGSLKKKKGQIDGCSGFVATGESTTDGKAILGRNDDWSSGFLESLILTRVEPADGNRFIAVTWAGAACAWTGLNEKGLGVGWAGAHITDFGFGFSHYSLAKLLLQYCDTVADANSFLRKVMRGFGSNFYLVDKGDDACVTEVCPSTINIIRPEEGVVFATNHFASEEMEKLNESTLGEVFPSTFIRYKRYVDLMREYKGKINIEIAKKIMSDHGVPDNPSINSICCHAWLILPGTRLRDRITVHSGIIKPSEGKMYISLRNPCQNPYESYRI